MFVRAARSWASHATPRATSRARDANRALLARGARLTFASGLAQEVPVYVDRVVEKVVEVPVDRVVEKIIEVLLPLPRHCMSSFRAAGA